MFLPYELEKSLEKVLKKNIPTTGAEDEYEKYWLRVSLFADISEIVQDHLDKLETKNV